MKCVQPKLCVSDPNEQVSDYEERDSEDTEDNEDNEDPTGEAKDPRRAKQRQQQDKADNGKRWEVSKSMLHLLCSRKLLLCFIIVLQSNKCMEA